MKHPSNSRRRVLATLASAAVAPLAPARVATAAAAPLGLALGSGSHHGHALIGALRALERRGFAPEVVVGTSVGAMVGALWASGMTADEIEQVAERFTLWRNARVTWPTRGLFSNRGLESTMRGLLGNRPIESWPRRFAAVASELETGKRVILKEGDGARAVAASAAMPVLCRPVEVGGRLLVDGALTEPVPSRAARELGAARVVALDIAYRPSDAPVDGLAAAGFQAMHILVNALIAEQRAQADVHIPMALHGLMEGRSEYRAILARAGEAAVEAAWPRIARA